MWKIYAKFGSFLKMYTWTVPPGVLLPFSDFKYTTVRQRGQGVRRRSPPEAERHSLFRCLKEGEIWPIVQSFSFVLSLTANYGFNASFIVVVIPPLATFGDRLSPVSESVWQCWRCITQTASCYTFIRYTCTMFMIIAEWAWPHCVSSACLPI